VSEVAQSRQQAYLELLHRGLVLVRNFAHSGTVELCRIEADHLHNIPTLLYEENEHRHEYYIRSERMLFLRRLRELGAVGYLEQAGIWYAEPWRILAEAAGVKLGAWDQEAAPGTSRGGDASPG
jgi:hypothetical protein